MKTWEGGGIAPPILPPQQKKEVSLQFHTPAILLPEKEPQYPLKERLRRPKSQFGCYGEERKPGTHCYN
jgi:hypothetical protein